MKSKQVGLSLIEVLVAIGIAGVILAALASGFNQALLSRTLNKEQFSAMADTRKILEHVRMIVDQKGLTGTGSVTDSNYWKNANNSGWLQTSTFSNLRNASRDLLYPDGTNQNPLHVRASVTWQEKNGTKTYSLDTLVDKRTG